MDQKERDQIKPPTKKTNWTLVGQIMRGSKRWLIGAVIAVVLSTLLAYATPMVFRFTVDSVIGHEPMDAPQFILNMVDNIGGRDTLINNLWICALVVICLTVFDGLFTFCRGRWSANASEGIAKRLRDRLFSHLQRLPYEYHVKAATGDLIQRCTSDVETVRRFLSVQLVEAGRMLLRVTMALLIMFPINATMALVSMSTLPVLAFFSYFYFKRVQKNFLVSDESEGRLSTTIQENLTGVRVVRAFGQQQHEVEKFAVRNDEYRDVTYKLIKLLGIYWGFSDIVGYIQIAISLSVSIYLNVQGVLTLGDVIIFNTYTGMLTWPVRQLGRLLADMGKALVSVGRIDEILSAPAEQERGKELSPPINGHIRFEHVDFAYDDGIPVLKDVSFEVQPGQTVALLGGTGSGKSSLVLLLQRLYRATGGRILIDGVDIEDIQSDHLRRSVGIVLQEPFLFSKTIRDNIGIARWDFTDEEIFESARIAALHDVINEFEQGYDTIVGERGVTLSGGQKQRVAIARMLTQNAPILIFDDSLSAVDTQTDMAIRQALTQRRQNVTTFIISHRVTTLMEADFIIVLEEGRITQMGSHEELSTQAGKLYERIFRIQNAWDESEQEQIPEPQPGLNP